MKYSLFNNVKYVFHHVFCSNKKLKIMIPLLVLSSILVPIFETIIPSIVVGFITQKSGLTNYLIVISSIFIAYSVFLYFKQFLFTITTSEYAMIRIREFYFGISSKLMKTDYINVEPQEKQIIIHKAMSSLHSNWVGIEFMMKNAPTFFINIVGLIIYSTFILTLNYFILIVLIVMSILNYLLNTYAQKYEIKHKNDYAKLDKQINYLYENSTSITNGKDIRIYKMKNWFYHVFHELIKKRVNWSRKIEYRYFLPSISDNILLFIRDIIAYSILINLVLNNKINVATFTLYIGIIGGFSIWLNNSVTALSNLKRANIGVNDYRRFMDIEEVFNHNDGHPIPTKSYFPLDIEFKNVSFRYPGFSEDTLKNLNFKITKGSKIAFVGNNGAGKTTLVKLVTGLYYPTEGEILVGGKSIKNYNIEEYHHIVGVVFQEVETLAFAIAKNVAASKERNIDHDKLWKSLELAGLKNKIESLKNKEQTYLTQYLDKDGILLSGGEMQKLMLARALYKNAPIMILDEPTAALDPLAEAELYEKYNDLTKEKTSLFISHRLSSTKFCDQILYLENGEIKEDGTHEELMKINGMYANMFKIQSHYYKDNLEVTENE
ncbi:ABC transporter ATP-binding protein [Mycoplasmatota bacterium]|nr:ABC transporter ATP-binding protein [Mycoplasmatota bacterium]